MYLLGFINKRGVRSGHYQPEKGGDQMNELRQLIYEEDGVGVVEIILILLVLIALVLIFKKQLTSLVNNILSKATSQSNQV